MKTAKICLAAVLRDGDALNAVSKGMKTQKLCRLTVQGRGTLAFVPDPLRTEAPCLEAAKRDGCALEFVPEAMRTAGVCLAPCKSSDR